MVKFVDRVKMNLTTTGTGTVTFGSVVSGFQSLADASVVDADVVRYTIESGTNYESGTGTISLTGSTYTMARSPSSSSESDNSAINLGSGAVCFLTMLAEDVVQNLADLDNVSSTSPAGGQNLSWDSGSSSWVPSSPSGGITTVGNYAGLPASPSETDLAWVSDQKSLYIYDGAEWDRVSTGSQLSPRYTTTPPSLHALNTNGATSTITGVAVDDAGFPIIYDWDGFSGSTVYNSNSLPDQITNVSQSNGSFTFTPSTNDSHSGSFTFRTLASDGVLTTPALSTVSLAFLPQHSNLFFHLDMGQAISYGGTGSIWYDISGNNNHVTWQNSTATNAGYKQSGNIDEPVWATGNYGSYIDFSATELSTVKTFMLIFDPESFTSTWTQLFWGWASSNTKYAGYFSQFTSVFLNGQSEFAGLNGKAFINGNSIEGSAVDARSALEQGKFNSLVFRNYVLDGASTLFRYTANTDRNHNLEVRAILGWTVSLTDSEIQQVHNSFPSMATWDG